MTTLTLEQLLTIHAVVMAKTGSQGLRDLGRLEAALAVQTQHVFGQELYDSVYEKAAALLHGITRDHPFVDGNKRTSLMACLVFLQINSVHLTASNTEVENFAVNVAADHLSTGEIAEWLQDHSVAGE
jgi:death-on-curing protein